MLVVAAEALQLTLVVNIHRIILGLCLCLAVALGRRTSLGVVHIWQAGKAKIHDLKVAITRLHTQDTHDNASDEATAFPVPLAADHISDKAHTAALVLEVDRVLRGVELGTRGRGGDPVLVGQLGSRQASTHTTSHVLENVWLERHVHVDRTDKVAELRALDVKDTREELGPA